MQRRFPMRTLMAMALVGLFSACAITDTLEEKGRIDYKSAGKVRTKSLDVPPDLTSPHSNERYAIPGAVSDRSYSAYERGRERDGADERRNAVAAKSPDAGPGLALKRDGQQRWLLAQMPAETLWPIIRDFWQESGFIIESESAASGVLETDWAENRAKLPQGLIRSTVGRVLNSLYSTGERDKFRTRLERVQQGTEIYVTHRGMVEVYQDKAEKDSTTWQPRPSDPELEIEFLRRLMLRLGAPADQARLAAKAAAGEGKAGAQGISAAADGTQQLTVNEGFERAWRRVGLALDRGGFAVEDRDRSKGIYFVRYIDPDSDARRAKPGILSGLFGTSRTDKVQTEVFQILIDASPTSSVVSVRTREGEQVKESDRATAGRMLALIQDQL